MNYGKPEGPKLPVDGYVSETDSISQVHGLGSSS